MTANLNLKDKKIGFVLTGSFCTFSKTIPKMKELIEKGAEVIPIMSFNSYNLDTKFGKAQDFINEIEEITGKKIIHTIQEAEPIGPKRLTDIMVVAPCSGNTMAKLACDIIDTPATMAVKSHLRNNLPVVIAPSTNNGLSGNAKNIGILLNRKHYYFVPFRQDNPITKPRSIVFDSEYIVKTIESALEDEQIEPILL
ncbi:MAG: dipicolinate synthase subunit B [Clostridium sp. 26_22]|jgi:dipicolinic acid synthetase, B subunit|nr:MAG: dipicolinate synthase subunit B [Clostridium sp. 26_22]